jgi:two-component system NarL family sensor kinase
VRSSITALRSSLVDIYPPDLDNQGIQQAFDDLAADASTDGRSVTVDAGRLPDGLPPAVTRLLYRAAREALRNVSLHAGASAAAVRAGVDGASVWVEITDNGLGFDPDTLPTRVAEGHLGLKGLEGVVDDAGGEFVVDSWPGRGTTVRVKVPVG